LNNDFRIKNERQDYRIGTVWEYWCVVEVVNRGDEGEGIWVIGFI
jgi:hypothetical protein